MSSGLAPQAEVVQLRAQVEGLQQQLEQERQQRRRAEDAAEAAVADRTRLQARQPSCQAGAWRIASTPCWSCPACSWLGKTCVATPSLAFS